MKTIEEIMGLIDVLEVHIESAATYCAKDNDDCAEAEYLLAIGVKKVIESALRELVEQTFHAGFEDGCKSMEGDQSWR